MTADPVDPYAAGFAAIRATNALSVKAAPATCRCGWTDHVRTEQAVIDMSSAPGIFAFDNTPIRRSCRACEHPITAGAVSHRPNRGHLVRNFYHAECIDLGGRND